MSGPKKQRADFRVERSRFAIPCLERLIVAPLWVMYEVNLGTLLRTCDAVGACLAVPNTEYYQRSLSRGDTLQGRRPHIHWVRPSKEAWIKRKRDDGWRFVAAELALNATPLPALAPAKTPTVLLLGNERDGVPDKVLAEVDECVEIPMSGWGASLNVAVAGSLVLYRLAGMS